MKLTIVGSNPQEATLLLNSQYISGYHAEILQLDNGDIYLIDKSTNGTFINGNRVTPGKEVQIQRGQNIVFADTTLDWSKIDDIKIPAGVKRVIGIGSHYSNNIVVSGATVSRFHACLRQLSNGKWEICDYSKNGTTLNGRRLPKGQWTPFKKSDKIACAGFPVDPKVGGSSSKMIGLIAASVAAILAIGIGGYKLISSRTLSDTEITNKYSPALTLMACEYHFEAHCGTLDMSDLPDPDYFNPYTGSYTARLSPSFVIIDNTLYPYDPESGRTMGTTGTGFFIGKEGNIATNRHVAKPWESDNVAYGDTRVTVVDAAANYFRSKLQKLYEQGYSPALSYISQVTVEGVLDYMRVIPNNNYFDYENSILCNFVACSSEEEDLAIFKIRRNGIPEGCTYVPLNKISKKDAELSQHILTIGFPFGLSIQDIDKTEIQALAHAGNISQTNDKTQIGFDASSYHGASGSPIFGSHGELIGILNSGIERSQGFNYGIRAKFLDNLVKSNNITR